MRYMDFSSWQGVLTTLLGLAVFTLIAAYRTLGGSFTGQLTVDPTHLRDMRVTSPREGEEPADQEEPRNSDRSRRIRDAVEAALADIILLGTEEHVRLAGKAARDMTAGRPIHTADLVVSLRNFIRTALDLEPIPEDVNILLQGPTRTLAGGGRGKGDGERAGKGSGSGGGMSSTGGAGMGPGMAASEKDHVG